MSESSEVDCTWEMALKCDGGEEVRFYHYSGGYIIVESGGIRVVEEAKEFRSCNGVVIISGCVFLKFFLTEKVEKLFEKIEETKGIFGKGEEKCH